MTNTGVFKIISLKMISIPESVNKVVDCITARCLRCDYVTTVTDGAIHHLTGGLVIMCQNCGQRQAVASAGLSSGN